jgi:hypothetical protein
MVAQRKQFWCPISGITEALEKLPDEIVIDGEIVALDKSGKPSSTPCKTIGSSTATLVFSSSTC